MHLEHMRMEQHVPTYRLIAFPHTQHSFCVAAMPFSRSATFIEKRFVAAIGLPPYGPLCSSLLLSFALPLWTPFPFASGGLGLPYAIELVGGFSKGGRTGGYELAGGLAPPAPIMPGGDVLLSRYLLLLMLGAAIGGASGGMGGLPIPPGMNLPPLICTALCC